MKVFRSTKDGKEIQMGNKDLDVFLKQNGLKVVPERHCRGRGIRSRLRTQFDMGSYSAPKAQYHSHAQIHEMMHCVNWMLQVHIDDKEKRVQMMRSFVNALVYNNYVPEDELVKKSCGESFKPNPSLGCIQNRPVEELHNTV